MLRNRAIRLDYKIMR
ncbi:hypothetical protein [Escherichia coli]|nr:hypothetical protein [Escherichia coli]